MMTSKEVLLSPQDALSSLRREGCVSVYSPHHVYCKDNMFSYENFKLSEALLIGLNDIRDFHEKPDLARVFVQRFYLIKGYKRLDKVIADKYFGHLPEFFVRPIAKVGKDERYWVSVLSSISISEDDSENKIIFGCNTKRLPDIKVTHLDSLIKSIEDYARKLDQTLVSANLDVNIDYLLSSNRVGNMSITEKATELSPIVLHKPLK